MDKIHEIRVEEVNDHEEGKHFYRVYMEINEAIKIIGESETKPQLIRYVSEVYWWNCILLVQVNYLTYVIIVLT